MFKWVKLTPNAPKIVIGFYQDSLIPLKIIDQDLKISKQTLSRTSNLDY